MSRRHYLRVPRSAVRRRVPPGHDRGVGRAGSRLSLSGRSVSSPPPASISFPHPLSHGAFFDIPGQWRPTPRSLAGAGRGSRILRTYVIRSDSDSRPGESSRLKVLNLIPPAKPLVKPHSQTRGLGHGRLWEAESACHGTCSSQEIQLMRCGKC